MESVEETAEPRSPETAAPDPALNPPGAYTTFLCATAVGYVGLLVFVFAYGLYGETLTSGIDVACAEAAFQSGQMFESKGNYDLAIQRYRQALQGRFADQAREYECGRSVGEVLVRLRRYEEAVDAYRALPPEAFTQPGHFTGYVTALLNARQYDEAERLGKAWLEKAQAAQDRQQSVWADATLGQLYQQTGRFEDALAAFRAAAALEPNGQSNIQAAQMLDKLGRANEGIQLLDALLARTPPAQVREDATRLRNQLQQKQAASQS